MSTQNTKDSTLYIRVPPALKLAVSRAAERERLSQNQYVQRVLEKATMHDSAKRRGDAPAVSAGDMLRRNGMIERGFIGEHEEPDF